MEKQGAASGTRRSKPTLETEAPRPKLLKNSLKTVNEFMRDDEEGEAEITVVCTYGTNRDAIQYNKNHQEKRH